MAAVEEAYKGSIMTGKFPACVLHLSLAFGVVDVNVHPAKLEVRFVNERPIFDAVYHAVRSALNTGDQPKVMAFKRPIVHPYAPAPETGSQLEMPPPVPTEKPSFRVQPVHRDVPLRDSGSEKKDFFAFAQMALEEDESSDQLPSAVRSLEEQKPVPSAAEENGSQEPSNSQPLSFTKAFHSRIIGEAFGTYILVEYSDSELMLIDKHAAHERLLYEQLKASGVETGAQNLIEPVPVTLSKEEYTAVLQNAQQLTEAGFEIEDFGTGTVIVRSIPMVLDGQDAADTVMEIAGYLADLKKDITPEHLDWVYHNVACRAAMKAGDHTNPEMLVSLAEQLERNPQVRYCPHGRPVYVVIKRRDLERQFGRV